MAALRPEDGMLAAWLGVGAPALTAVGGDGVAEGTLAGIVILASVVAAPRQLADPEDAGFRWVIRFGLFLVAAMTGIGWLTLIG